MALLFPTPETPLERLIRERTQIFQARHNAELEAWAEKQHKVIHAMAVARQRGLGQLFRHVYARLDERYFRNDHVAAMEKVQRWLDLPFPLQGDLA